MRSPVLVGDTEEEFSLETKLPLSSSKAEDAAGHHCHVGAATLMNQQVYRWFEEVISNVK